jgi:hypothetical protein
MASILKVDTIQDQSGNNIINENADTITIGASGDTINVVGTLQNNGSNAVGITMADQWRVTANITDNVDPISSNLERVDEPSFSGIGTGMTVSSGIFSFPQTGIYLVRFIAFGNAIINDNVDITIKVTTDNSTYDSFTVAGESGDNGTGNFTMTAEAMIDVTNTSNVKVRFQVASIASGSSLNGSSGVNYTYMTFIRLGDT